MASRVLFIFSGKKKTLRPSTGCFVKYDIPSEIYISPLRSNIQTFVYLKVQFINEELKAQFICRHETGVFRDL